MILFWTEIFLCVYTTLVLATIDDQASGQQSLVAESYQIIDKSCLVAREVEGV